ncbi:CPBP family intramembrane glutamic endopeptidase [Candidatus Clostridium radicumherbarum]|uniref:CPBP family intramembrane glutamic endopeptidase n=1 Tax=Candidatus Clostridium radicumherbarum TaxID=3381662 RepID=A0ABW8TWW2_9CLOT
MKVESVDNRFKLSLIGAFGIILIYYVLIAGIFNIPFAIISELNYFKSQEVLQAVVMFLGSLISYVITIKLILRKIRKKNKNNFKISFIDKLNFKIILCTLLLIIGYYLWFQNSFGILIQRIPLPQFIESAFETLAVNEYSLIATVVIIAPIFEEIIMRGIILEGFLNKYKPVTAIILSALLFGFIHLNIPQFINTTIIGIILALIYYKTRSLILCICAHALNNTIALFSGYLTFKFNIFIIFLGMIIFITAGSYLLKYFDEYLNEKGINVEEI